MDGSSDSRGGPGSTAPEAGGDVEVAAREAEVASVVALARSLADRVGLLRDGVGDGYEIRLAHALALDIVDLLEAVGRR